MQVNHRIQNVLLIVYLFVSLQTSASSLDCGIVYGQRPSSSTINHLLHRARSEPPHIHKEKKILQKALQLNDLNFAYYFSLFTKYKEAKPSDVTQLFPAEARFIGYPVRGKNVPREINESVESVTYNQIASEFSGTHALNTVLVIKKLHAGTGSSIAREDYFAKNPELAGLKMGAKGTDLMVEIPHPLDANTRVKISIVELQLLQLLKVAKSKDFSKVLIQDIVGPETQNRLKQVWQKKSLLDPRLTYAQLFEKEIGIGRLSSLFQSHVPALTEKGEMSFNRQAPAGHGLFAVEALRAILYPKDLPSVRGKSLVSAIANGEDLNSLPDKIMIDWIVKNKIPITLVTTTKASIDKKGGILVLVKDTQTGEQYLKVMDTAEAKASGQIEVFEATEGIASTNLTLFNYDVLQKKLAHLSEEALLKIMAPDLIPNWKEQKDPDGVVRKYLQLEGTMGSVIMNLDRYYRKTFGEPLVHILNIESPKRLDFFSPIKSAFDYFLQFHSDIFSVDTQNYKLKFNGAGEQPNYLLRDPITKDKYYQEVQNVLDSFKDTSVRELTDLHVAGQVVFGQTKLQGRVVLKNDSGSLVHIQSLKGRLPNEGGKILLKNIEITWTGQEVLIKPIPLEKGVGIAYARVATSGSHTDYNLGLTLAALLPVKTETKIKPRSDQTVNVTSADKYATFEIGREQLKDDWSDYIRGWNTTSAQK